MLTHPLMNLSPRRLYYSSKQTMSGDVFSDIYSFVKTGVEGLWEAAGKALDATLQVIGNIVKLIVQIVQAAFGQISWDEVVKTLGEVVRGVFNVIALVNPYRFIYDVLTTSEVTAHSFKELDRFTGGFVTNAVNVSDVVYRGMRGDAITKVELIKDALFMLQIGAILVAGPGAAGAVVGNWVGNEVCRHQAEESQEACKIAFTIVGAAAGGYVSESTGVNWKWDPFSSSTSSTTAAAASSGTTATATEAGREIARQGFREYLSTSAQQVAEQRITQEATRLAIRLCQDNNWVGDRECAILGQIAANYINAPEGTKWETFLAEEAARLGVALLIEQAFPPDSPEANAIRYEITHNYYNVPGQNVVINPEEQPGPNNLGKFLAIIAAAGALLAIGS